jgi:hypothetical protein
MAIVRLAVANPSSNTNTVLHSATRGSLASVIATNLDSTEATVRIWIQPSSGSASYLTYDTILPGNNSLETFRFGLQNYDTVYVRASSPNISFSLHAVYESTGTQNTTVSANAPGAPVVGDVWVNSLTYYVYYWNGSSWVSATSDTNIMLNPLLLSGM